MAAAPRAAPLLHVNMHCRAVDGFMALAGVEGTVRCPATVCLQTVRGGSDAGDFLILWDLVEKLGQHRGISDVAGGELGSPGFQCLFVDSDVDLAP